MTSFSYAHIQVSGADSFEFLQGQLSNDLKRLDRETHLLAAWCNPKGRVICLPRVSRSGDIHTLTLPAALAEVVVQRLTLFRFRAKVEFVIEPFRPGSPGMELVADESIAAWRLHNLVNGIPEIGPAQSEQFTPHMLNLDRIDAISLDKGCYTGQEIVARTHYRGASKRRMLLFTSATPVEAGAPVTAADRKVGDVVNAIANSLLAIVPLEARDAELNVNGIPLTAEPLPYEFT